MRERLERWWREDSPWARARRRGVERARRLGEIDLDTADRVAAVLLRGEPAIRPIDVSTPDAADAYTTSFLARCGGRSVGAAFLLAAPEQSDDVDDRAWTVAAMEGEDLVVGRGDLRVRWMGSEEALAPSLPHHVLEVSLDDAEIAALHAAAATWVPDLARHPPPTVHPALPPPLALDERSRAWAAIGAPLVLALVVAVLAVVALHAGVPRDPRQCCGACGVLLLAAVGYWNLARVVEVYVLEPRARRLRIDEHGLRHPRSGAPVAWEAARDLERRWLGFVVTLPDGLVVYAPWSVFLDPARAEARLRGRVGKIPAGPYRTG